MFERLTNQIDYETVRRLFRIQVAQRPASPIPEGAVETRGNGETQTSPLRKKKVGRNDPCPCGATKPDGTPKKYKHCCYPKYG